MPVATRPSSLLIRHALEQAGLASLLESRSADTISRSQIETLLRPDTALLAARIAHQRRLDAFGMTTTYARSGDGDEPDVHRLAPPFATWSEALVWGRDHVGSCGPTPETVVALAKGEGLCTGDAGKALKTVGFAALAPTVMPDVADDAWLEQMAGLHAAGLTLTVAMPFSADELPSRWVDRVQHLRRWQANQPIASAMMIWPKQLDSETDLASVPTGFGILQMTALARILVDNVPHLTVPWAMTGVKLGQITLSWGADDWVGPVGHDPGDNAGPVDAARLIELITVAGLEPAARDAAFHRIGS
jgi:aminodeoxyfutalosine synthase